ncbi:hypothetical protein [Bacteroides sp.]|nr:MULTISPECIES: hypothetical protein [Bacteroides]
MSGARILSRIFTPFSVPFLSFVALLLFSHLNLTFTARDIFYILDIIFRYTIVMPIISIFFIHKINHLSYIEQHPRERSIGAFMISTFCYLFTFIIFAELRIPLISNYILSCAVVFALFILVPIKWKVDVKTNGLVKSNSGVLTELNEREQRFMPLLLTIISYFFCAVIMFKRDLPWYMNGIIIASLIILLIHLIINARWRVSEHMAAIGGVMGGVIAFSSLFLYDPTKWICIFTAIAGALGTTRMILGHNNLGEIFAGFIIGLSCTLIALNDTYNHLISSFFKYIV